VIANDVTAPDEEEVIVKAGSDGPEMGYRNRGAVGDLVTNRYRTIGTGIEFSVRAPFLLQMVSRTTEVSASGIMMMIVVSTH